MRSFVITIVAVAALAGATFALASAGTQGDQGGGPAFALVNPNNGSPRLIDAHTSGFVSVSVGPFGPGDYCLTPAAGVDVVHTAAVASEEAYYSNTVAFVTVRYPPSNPSCAPGQLEVKTFTQALDGTISLSDQIGFTVDVP